MTDLGQDARSFLDSVRDADDPSAADAERIRSRLAARIGITAAGASAATLGAKSAAAGAGAASTATAVGASTLATKVLVLLVVAGATAGVTVAAVRRAATPPVQHAAITTPLATTVAPYLAPAPTLPTPSVTAEPTAAPTAIGSASAGGLASLPPALPPAPRRLSTTTVGSAAPDSLLEEAALIRSANAALSSGDAATALARIDDHAARFPHGALGEERNATRVHALCAAGRITEARAAATAFVAVHPRSALAPAVRRSCAAE